MIQGGIANNSYGDVFVENTEGVPTRIRVYLYLLLIFNFSCTNFDHEKIVVDDTIKKEESQSDLQRDSLEDAYFAGVVKEFENDSKKELIIDTMYQYQNDTFSIHLEYKPDNSATVVVPEKYVSVFGLKKLETHPFLCNLIIEKNNLPFFLRRITIDTFREVLDESLHLYGVVKSPVLSLDSAQVKIRFSVSIPLTDVGRECSAVIDLNKGELIAK